MRSLRLTIRLSYQNDGYVTRILNKSLLSLIGAYTEKRFLVTWFLSHTTGVLHDQYGTWWWPMSSNAGTESIWAFCLFVLYWFLIIVQTWKSNKTLQLYFYQKNPSTQFTLCPWKIVFSLNMAQSLMRRRKGSCFFL